MTKPAASALKAFSTASRPKCPGGIPTLVEPDALGYLPPPYGTYDPMTVEAIRALNDKMEALEVENAMLKTQLNAQAAQLQQITAALQTAGISVEQR